MQPADAQRVDLSDHGTDSGLAQRDTVCALYAEIFAEHPYLVGSAEVSGFTAQWAERVATPGFRLVLARDAGVPIGFVFGYQLQPRTSWWHGALTPLSPYFVTEWEGRTFAIIEIGVRRQYRRRGVARRMHAKLLAGLSVERVTLMVLPEMVAARHAYLSWGYQPVGRLRPFPDGPAYDAMVRSLARARRTGGAPAAVR